MLRTLFWKVYLTLIAALVLVSLAMVLLVHIETDEDATTWRERRTEIVTSLLSPDMTEAELRRVSRALRADIAIYSASGDLEAGTGAPARLPGAAPGDHRLRMHSHTLGDGRSVVVRFAPPPPRRHHPLLPIAFVAAIIGVAAYPVVRHVTRRLETLKRGVDDWGDGDLVTRVPVEGQDEVASVAMSFNRAADKIEKLLSVHRALLANASHELRSPLARLRMAVDLYEDPNSPGRTPALRQEILRSIGELDELVEEILLASRLDHVGGLDHREPVDLLALLAEEAARLDIEVAGDDNSAVDVAGPSGGGPSGEEPSGGRSGDRYQSTVTDGDPKLLRRLVRNLLNNALRHGAPPVDARVESAPGWVRVSVRDHGRGISGADRDRLFEPFYRPGGHAEASGGWGLGLSLVRQIAQHHGGQVDYSPAPGGGACFTVTLPASHGNTSGISVSG